jgi:very-short-patch-repair endonuclease
VGTGDRPLGFFQLVHPEKRLVVVACEDAGAALQPVLKELRRRCGPRTVVASGWRQCSTIRDGVESIVEALARAALDLWPRWYGVRDRPPAIDGRGILRHLEEAARRVAGVSLTWLQAATRLATDARLPVVPRIEPAAQVEQLAHALGPGEVVLVLACASGATPDPLPLVSAVRWAAAHSALRILVLVPSALATAPELDPISTQVLHLEHAHTLDGSDALVVGVWTVDAEGASCSLGELELRHRIASDDELRPLFFFDQRVDTNFGTAYQADAVWRDGRICVEVDGHQWHARPAQFNRDRQRDYEMVVSGYLVLRLPHDEVLSDPERALEKVRAVVRFRRQEDRY